MSFTMLLFLLFLDAFLSSSLLQSPIHCIIIITVIISPKSYFKYTIPNTHISRYCLQNILLLRNLQIVLWYILRRLVLESPLPNSIKIPTLVFCVEIWIRQWAILIPPNLSKHPYIHVTHQVLSQDIKAMGCTTYQQPPTYERARRYLLTWYLTISSEFLKAPSPRAW